MKILEYDHQKVEQKIFELHPTKDSEKIYKAIREISIDNHVYQNELMDKYRIKLINMKSRQSRDILIRYFPGYVEQKLELPEKHFSEESTLTDLLRKVKQDTLDWPLPEGSRFEISEQLESMMTIGDQPDRLLTKWLMTKHVIPEDKKSDVNIMRLDEIISLSKASFSHLEEKDNNFKRRKFQPKFVDPLQLCKIDLHELSLSDAQELFNSTFDEVKDSEIIGALLIIHGYGKDKSESMIKSWLVNRSKRLKNHRRVIRIIKGENISDEFDENAQLIKQAVENINISDIVNNQGISVIVFDRSKK